MKTVEIANIQLVSKRLFGYHIRCGVLHCCLSMVVFFSVSTTLAQTVPTICIPYGNGGAYSPGPPQWWRPPGDQGWDRFNDSLDDPRWEGATSITYGDGADEQVQFRALYNPQYQGAQTQYVYLSWWVEVAPVSNLEHNTLWVGLKSTEGHGNLVLKVQLNSLDPAKASVNCSAQVFPVGADGVLQPAIDLSTIEGNWVNEIRVWVNGLEDGSWAVNVRFPINANLGSLTESLVLGQDFNMWYEVLMQTPPDPQNPGGEVVPYTWPRPYFDQESGTEKTFEVTTQNFAETVPEPNTWPSFRLCPDLTADNTCQAGITITGDDISVTYDGSSSTTHIATNKINTFHARPTNQTGGPIESDTLHARFRIANWGNQPDSRVADPTTGIWNTVRGLGDVQQVGAQIGNDQKWDISGTWQPDPTVPDEAGFFNDSKSPHQCIQVELSGSNLVFLQSSAFNNMYVASASTFSEPAEVNTLGLPSMGGEQRNVYLYIETKNMPSVIYSNNNMEQGEPLLSGLTHIVGKLVTKVPTYIVHAYYESGRNLRVDGKDRPILLSMISYGYFVKHQGDLEGWQHALDGAEKITDTWYRLAVPQDGKKTVMNTIEAIEFRRFAVSAQAGIGLPHANLSNTWDPGISGQLALEYRFNPMLSAQIVYGFAQFKSKVSGVSDLKVSQYLAQAKYYRYLGDRFLAYGVVGAGNYVFDPGVSKGGVNAGVGLQYDISWRVGILAAFSYNAITSGNNKPSFSAIQCGVRVKI